MNIKPKTNCYEETSYYASPKGAVIKTTVKIEPSHHRERVTSEPVIAVICSEKALEIDLDRVVWDEIGHGIPDGKVSVDNGDDFWIEHTRIGDHNQHYINESLKIKSDKYLDDLGAPKNLFLRYPDNTQIRAALHFCDTWQEWKEVENWQEAFEEVIRMDKQGTKQLIGFKISELKYDPLRMYFLEASSQDLGTLFEKIIKTKEKKYRSMATMTVLVIDDETRAYTADEVITVATKYSKKCKTSFKAIYVVSFEGLNNKRLPSWKYAAIKSYS